MIARVIEDWKQRDVCDKYTMTRMAYISRRFSNFIIGLYTLSVFLYATGTLLRYRSSNQTDTRELILKMELPFEIKSTTVHLAVLVTQFIHLTSAASMVGVMNSLLITLVSLSICRCSWKLQKRIILCDTEKRSLQTQIHLRNSKYNECINNNLHCAFVLKR